MINVTWKENSISLFVLGTAQFGMEYGIANIQGQPDKKLICEMVETAWAHGVNCFDTAQAYGNSEIVLGEALRYCGIASDVKIISKLSPDLETSDDISIEQSIERSCQNLGIDQLWCLMLHRADWLDVWNIRLGQILVNAKKKGLVKYLGVSAYSPDDARKALEHPDIQIVQVPCNAWDQAMRTSGIFELAENLNKLCFVRSVYLQGLLVLSPDKVAAKLPRAEMAAKQWWLLAAKFRMEPKQLAIGFGLFLNAPLVIGAETPQQVEENIRMCEQRPLSLEIIKKIRSQMSPLLNENIINPVLWKE